VTFELPKLLVKLLNGTATVSRNVQLYHIFVAICFRFVLVFCCFQFFCSLMFSWVCVFNCHFHGCLLPIVMVDLSAYSNTLTPSGFEELTYLLY